MRVVDDNFERLKRPERKLTRFVAREMLYDYFEKKLDSDRSLAIKNFLQSDEELSRDLEAIRLADEYMLKLSQTAITQKHLLELSELNTGGQKFRKKLRWSAWPESFKWSVEALALSGVIAVAMVMIPWANISWPVFNKKTEIILSEVNSQKIKEEELPKVAAKIPEKKEIETKGAEVKPESKVVAQAPQEVPQTTVSQITDESEQETAPSKPATTQQKGFLYRMTMNLENSEAKAALIKNKIIELGGQKAGQVELGWRKTNPEGNYFHFTLPEANYQQLLTALGELGTTRITKNKHERVMPDGQIRGILWIQDQIQSSNPVSEPPPIDQPVPPEMDSAGADTITNTEAAESETPFEQEKNEDAP